MQYTIKYGALESALMSLQPYRAFFMSWPDQSRSAYQGSCSPPLRWIYIEPNFSKVSLQSTENQYQLILCRIPL